MSQTIPMLIFVCKEFPETAFLEKDILRMLLQFHQEEMKHEMA
jgi:hypothetical protein